MSAKGGKRTLGKPADLHRREAGRKTDIGDTEWSTSSLRPSRSQPALIMGPASSHQVKSDRRQRGAETLEASCSLSMAG